MMPHQHSAFTIPERSLGIIGRFVAAILFVKFSIIVTSGQSEGSCPLSATVLRYDKSTYVFDDGEQITGTLLIDPVPAHGLYSMGFNIIMRNEAGNVAGFITPTPEESLNFDGVLPSFSSRSLSGQSGALKGSIDFFDAGKPAHLTPTVASFNISSAPPGTYHLSMDFWNDLGASEDIFVTGCCSTLDNFLTFGTATLTIVVRTPDLTSVGDLQFNPQTGLIEQRLTFTNNGTQPISSFRLFVENLPAEINLRNAHGSLGGVPYIDMFTEISPAGTVEAVLEYYDPKRSAEKSPDFRIERTEAVPPSPNPNGDLFLELRIIEISGKGVLVEFLTVEDVDYLIEYSGDMNDWKVASPSLKGTGQRVQWLDSGLPKTTSFPHSKRFYRITRLK